MRITDDIPKGILCANCKKHKATVKWGGNAPMFAATHGFIKYWCKCCALKEQIKHVKEQGKRLLEELDNLEECS